MRIFYSFILLLFLFSCKDPVVESESAPKDLLIESVSPLLGSSGTEVTITGANFAENFTYQLVLLGEAEIIPVRGNGTSLVFVIPTHIIPGSYPVKLKLSGKEYNSRFSFEVEKEADQPIPDKIPIDKYSVQKGFQKSGVEGVHPRLFYNEERIAEIMNTVNGDRKFAAKTYADIMNQAKALLNAPLKNWQLDGANLRITAIHDVGNTDLPILALAYLFTKDASYAERCYRQMQAMCSWKDWGASRHFLDTGIGARGFGMAYDAIYDYLNENQRKELVSGLRRLALEPGRLQIETGQGQAWAWYNANNNWNGICNGGLICAALAVYETDPEFMSHLIALASNKMMIYMQSFEPDGASEEGMMYWSYGLTNAFFALEAMKRNLTTTYGLTDLNGISKTGWFPYYVSGPVGTATFGDDYLYYGKTNKFLSYFWFAHFFNDVNLAKKHFDECMSRQGMMNGYHDLLFYYPEQVSQGAQSEIPLQGYLKGADYMYVNENNSDINAFYVGMHGGNNNANHGHLDAGSFNVQANGECVFIGNLGKPDPYPADYFNETAPYYESAPTTVANTTGRFYYYRVRSEGKSCLIFNPDARPEQNPKGTARLINQSIGDNGGFYVLDMSDVYKRDVDKYIRAIKLNRTTQTVTIQDEFIPKKSGSTIYWLGHTSQTGILALSSDKKVATCLKNGKSTLIRIVSPVAATFDIVQNSETDINYLDETRPIFSSVMKQKNPINRWYGKLQIKLQNISNPTTITVEITNNNVNNNPSVPIDEWSGRD